MKKFNLNIILKFFVYLMIILIIAPLIIIVLWSFTSKWPWPHLLPTEYSLRAIEEVFSNHNNALSILFSSIFISIVVCLLSTFIGLVTSRAMVFYDFKGKKIIGFFSISSYLVPSTILTMGIHTIFIRLSLANNIFGVILIHLIYTIPYSFGILKDLTESIGCNLEIQSYVLGVSPIKSFFYVSLPLLTPGIISSMTMAYITSFSQYFITLIIGGGNVQTFNMLIVPFIAKGDRALSSAFSLVFILSTLSIVYLINFILKKSILSSKGE